jgi:hypothetical protein
MLTILAVTRVTFRDHMISINSDDAVEILLTPYPIQHNATNPKIIAASSAECDHRVSRTNSWRH